MFKDGNFMDTALLAGMGICLFAYIGGHFTNNPFPEMVELIKWLGVGLGLTAAGTKLNK